jgi:hypothetical protein
LGRYEVDLMIKDAGAARSQKAALIYFIIIALWGVYVLWAGWGVMDALNTLLHIRQSGMGDFGALGATAALALNLWALAAALIFIPVWVNFFSWLNLARLSMGVVALTLMLGRLDIGWIAKLSHFPYARETLLGSLMR